MKGMTEFIKAYGSTLPKDQQGSDQPIPLRMPIAISRQIGSGGRLVAARLAERLGLELVSKSIIEEISHRTKVPTDLLDLLDEKPGRALELFGAGLLRGASITESDYNRVLKATVATFLELGNAIILGRGSIFVALPGRALRLLIVAPLENRIEAMTRYEDLTPQKARARVLEIDSERRQFNKRHFGHEEASAEHYDLVVNTAMFSVDEAAEISICAYQKMVEANRFS